MPDISLNEGLSAISGYGLAVFINYVRRRPPHTGIYMHAVLIAGGYLCGGLLDKWVLRQRHQKLHILKDYVRLHPDEFPDEEPKKYKDLLLPWQPVR
ncbi:NADH dehydrogenase [ubiquinone] 1 subunit C2-like [Gigantopelta aegis]|uniref:NADH dehydrogenase [ubiquinone] 1 subunit C2-like n=1 Tax=Gigantopelta aegis TaxID=1735272 RepID=UPI001B88C10C|nr:NADH dehydrogenase [ubiquinone] 1 subunit C2-like [Gigantopelta aegis]